MGLRHVPRPETCNGAFVFESNNELHEVLNRDRIRTLGEYAVSEQFLPWPEEVRGSYDDVRQILEERIVGQSEPIEAVIEALDRSHARKGGRPIASLMFLGPSGVGKTEVAKVLVDALKQRGHYANLVTVDCASLGSEHDGPAFLLGSPPGFVGYEDDPKFHQDNFAEPGSDARTVLVLDELEKASPSTWRAIFPVLDEGRATLKDGSVTSFENTIIIATSNVGSSHMVHAIAGAAGFGSARERADVDKSAVVAAALRGYKEHFSDMPEFTGRFDKPIVFTPHGTEELRTIAGVALERRNAELRKKRGIEVVMSDVVAERLVAETSAERHLGARPVVNALDNQIVGPVGRYIGSGHLSEGQRLRVYHAHEFDTTAPDRLLFSVEKDESLCLPTPVPIAIKIEAEDDYDYWSKPMQDYMNGVWIPNIDEAGSSHESK